MKVLRTRDLECVSSDIECKLQDIRGLIICQSKALEFACGSNISDPEVIDSIWVINRYMEQITRSIIEQYDVLSTGGKF